MLPKVSIAQNRAQPSPPANDFEASREAVSEPNSADRVNILDMSRGHPQSPSLAHQTPGLQQPRVATAPLQPNPTPPPAPIAAGESVNLTIHRQRAGFHRLSEDRVKIDVPVTVQGARLVNPLELLFEFTVQGGGYGSGGEAAFVAKMTNLAGGDVPDWFKKGTQPSEVIKRLFDSLPGANFTDTMGFHRYF